MSETDSTNPLDELLARMPDIAKAVSEFPEGVQQSVLETLMAAATGAPASRDSQATLDPKKRSAERAGGGRRKPRSTGANGAKRRGTSSAQPKQDKDLDLRPKGKKSFADFVKEKNPTSNHDKNVVTVYYLANIAGLSSVTRDQVYTAYREVGWKLPSDFANSLQVTATKKRYLDTADSENLRLLNPGLNRVEQELPLKTNG